MTGSTILVGVDGGQAGLSAVDYAARYAARNGANLRVLHVAGNPASPAVHGSTRCVAAEQRHSDVLDAAVGRAARLMGDEDRRRITGAVAFGGRVDRLLAASEGCDLVVLGDHRRPQVDRLATGSVLAGVAARAEVPVVGVPAGWTPAANDGVVVAAVRSTADSGALLAHACAAAADVGARLRVLHVRTSRHGAPGHNPTCADTARADLMAGVAPHCGEYDGLTVEVEVMCGPAVRVLVDASTRAELMVITRRPGDLPSGHLGTTGRAVLRESRCPVAVLPPSPSRWQR